MKYPWQPGCSAAASTHAARPRFPKLTDWDPQAFDAWYTSAEERQSRAQGTDERPGAGLQCACGGRGGGGGGGGALPIPAFAGLV